MINKLTEKQKRLIEDTLPEIKNKLKLFFSNRDNRRLHFDAVSESISYIPEIVLKFDASKAKRISFVDYVASRCVTHLIDEYHRINPSVRINRYKEHIIDRIKGRQIRNKGYCTDTDIKDSLLRFKLRKQIFAKRANERNIHQNREILEDKLNIMAAKADIYFSNTSGTSATRDKINSLHKIVIKEYVVPLLKQEDHKSLTKIAAENNITLGRVSQILHDHSMRNFIQKIANE
jgi:hypothetical protein